MNTSDAYLKYKAHDLTGCVITMNVQNWWTVHFQSVRPTHHLHRYPFTSAFVLGVHAIFLSYHWKTICKDSKDSGNRTIPSERTQTREHTKKSTQKGPGRTLRIGFRMKSSTSSAPLLYCAPHLCLSFPNACIDGLVPRQQSMDDCPLIDFCHAAPQHWEAVHQR